MLNKSYEQGHPYLKAEKIASTEYDINYGLIIIIC